MLYQFEHFILDQQYHKLFCEGKLLSDDGKTIKLLGRLCESYPEVVDKQVLIEYLWPDQVVTDWSLSKLVSDVRQLLGDSGKDQGYIKTVRGRGFRFNSEVKELTKMPNKTSAANFHLAPKHLKIVSAFLLSLLVIITGFGVITSENSSSDNSHPIRVAILPVTNEKNEPVNEWIKYGIMSMATEQLSSYQSIQTLPVATVINFTADLDYKNSDLELFDQVCGQIGCTHLVAIKYNNGSKNNPVLTYQILTDNHRSPISDFSQADILDTADMLLDYLASALIPSENQRLSLEDTYSDDKKANRDYAIGVDELFRGDIKSAKIYLQMALVRKPDFLWALAYLAEAKYRSGEINESAEIIQQMKQRKLTGSQSYFLQHLVSNILYSQGKLEESMAVSIALQKSDFTISDPLLMGNELLNIGSSLQALGRMEKAISYLEKSRQAYQQANYGSGEGKALYNMANVYLTTQRRQQAIAHYQQAREVFIKFKMTGYALMSKQQIATTNLSLGKIQNAEGELSMVITGYKNIGDLEGEMTACMDLVDVSIAKGNFVEAKERAEKLLLRLESEEFSYLIHHANAILARIYLHLGELDKAEFHYNELNGEWKDIRPSFVFIEAHILHDRGHLQQALDSARQIRQQLGIKWTDAHQDILFQFERSTQQSKITPMIY